MILRLVAEAVAAGARLVRACETLGLDVRTVQRWRARPEGEDRRCGPKSDPPNKLSRTERERVLAVVNSPQYRDLSPNQIVPRLADDGRYLASEATIYRLLREEDMLAHRAASRPPVRREPPRHRADGPNQIWSWDISYLPSSVRGQFYYLYLIVDVWSRKIVGASVECRESAELARQLMLRICEREAIEAGSIVLHSDNGGPMKGATFQATLEALGVAASYSRPRVANDNPFSESLFRTLKYRPSYPRGGRFDSLDAARAWVDDFVGWYNGEHRHSGIRFVTPAQRHAGQDRALLERRHRVYEAAKRRHPHRWGSRSTRNWSPIEQVDLNPDVKSIA